MFSRMLKIFIISSSFAVAVIAAENEFVNLESSSLLRRSFVSDEDFYRRTKIDFVFTPGFYISYLSGTGSEANYLIHLLSTGANPPDQSSRYTQLVVSASEVENQVVSALPSGDAIQVASVDALTLKAIRLQQAEFGVRRVTLSMEQIFTGSTGLSELIEIEGSFTLQKSASHEGLDLIFTKSVQAEENITLAIPLQLRNSKGEQVQSQRIVDFDITRDGAVKIVIEVIHGDFVQLEYQLPKGKIKEFATVAQNSVVYTPFYLRNIDLDFRSEKKLESLEGSRYISSRSLPYSSAFRSTCYNLFTEQK